MTKQEAGRQAFVAAVDSAKDTCVVYSKVTGQYFASYFDTLYKLRGNRTDLVIIHSIPGTFSE